MNRKKILFVCIHNSARSQMAEAFLNTLGADRFEAESAGLEKGTLNPLAVEAMSEIGIDISKNQTKKVFDFYKEGKLYTHVITVCDEASAEQCPVFPGIAKQLHWSFSDPSQFQGTKEEKLQQVRVVRDEIRKKIEDFIAQSV
ncbi:MAG: arsenate reductase ArsC [Bacteroidia bacterium]